MLARLHSTSCPRNTSSFSFSAPLSSQPSIKQNRQLRRPTSKLQASLISNRHHRSARLAGAPQWTRRKLCVEAIRIYVRVQDFQLFIRTTIAAATSARTCASAESSDRGCDQRECASFGPYARKLTHYRLHFRKLLPSPSPAPYARLQPAHYLIELRWLVVGRY